MLLNVASATRTLCTMRLAYSDTRLLRLHNPLHVSERRRPGRPGLGKGGKLVRLHSESSKPKWSLSSE